MPKLKKLRKQCAKLACQVEILEQQQRIAELKRQEVSFIGFRKRETS